MNTIITIKKYNEVFDDSLQTITVSAEASLLQSLSVAYKTKPRTIKVDTVIPIKIPANDRAINLYTEIGIPMAPQVGVIQPIIFKAGIDYETKSNWIFGVSYDTRGTGWGKIGKKLNF